MSAEKEFAEFRNTPWMFRYAAMRNPKDPHGAMRRLTARRLEAADAEPWLLDLIC
jgi:hypothetical protein